MAEGANAATHDGGCHCQAVRYRVTGPPQISLVCHCSSCRRTSGAPSVAWLTFDRRQVEYLAGDRVSYASSAGVLRRFCGTCGSPISYETCASAATIDLTTLSLDDPNVFPPTGEVWLEHKIAWAVTDGTLEHYPRGSVGAVANGGAELGSAAALFEAPLNNSDRGVDMTNRISFIELPAASIATTKAFYASAFGFAMTDFGPTYACTLTGDVDLGIQADAGEATRAPLAVIQVESVEATEASVRRGGGVVTKAIFAFPGGRRFHFRDPAGNELAAMQPD